MTLAMFTMVGTLAVAAMYSLAPGFEGETKILVAGMALGGTTSKYIPHK